MGLTALYLFCLMQLCLDINLACQFPFGCVAGAVLLCLLFSPLVSLRQLFGIEGFSLIEILDGENAQQKRNHNGRDRNCACGGFAACR